MDAVRASTQVVALPSGDDVVPAFALAPEQLPSGQLMADTLRRTAILAAGHSEPIHAA